MSSKRDTPAATATLDAPPTYEAATSSPASSSAANNANASGTAQDQARQGGQQTRQAKQGISNTFTRYEATPGWGTVSFLLVTDRSTLEYSTVSWAATLVIKCDDVSRLMRDGLFWSPDNVVPEEGYFFLPRHRQWLAHELKRGRTWILADKSNGANPRWVGRLEVSACVLEVLQTFRLHNLSLENVSRVYAQNGSGQMVYNYARGWPGSDLNSIYDDKHLAG